MSEVRKLFEQMREEAAVGVQDATARLAEHRRGGGEGGGNGARAMSLPPYPGDDWGRWRVAAVLLVLLAVVAGRPERRPVRESRPPAVTEEREPPPETPWVGCCKTRPEL